MQYFTHLLSTITISAKDVGAPDVSLDGLPKLIVNTMLEIAGTLSVIFIIVGGLQMALSSGDPKRVESARNTITYAIVGLIITALAFAIVGFVTGKL